MTKHTPKPFEPSRSFTDNLIGLLGADYYVVIARHIGGENSTVWQAQLDELRAAFDAMDKYDPEAVQAWVEAVLRAAGR